MLASSGPAVSSRPDLLRPAGFMRSPVQRLSSHLFRQIVAVMMVMTLRRTPNLGRDPGKG
jgi:hypothetical protein